MEERTAILFPGQGSHADGMREEVERHAPELAELTLKTVGDDAFARAAESTRFAQPAILSASLAAWIAAGRPQAAYFAGHSLGELSALAAAGSLSFGDAVRLAARRGELMDAAGAKAPGGMVALLGDRALAAEVAATTGLVAANDNGPTQTVLAGPLDQLPEAEVEAKQRGLRALRLPVAGAFHSPAMEPAMAPFAEALATVEVSLPRVPVVSCATARPHAGPAEIRETLAAGLVRPVRWRETLEYLRSRGVDTLLETGPGKALTAIAKRAVDGVDARVLEPAGLHA
jgi:malonyl CoA-acyl carrier protein transacylase